MRYANILLFFIFPALIINCSSDPSDCQKHQTQADCESIDHQCLWHEQSCLKATSCSQLAWDKTGDACRHAKLGEQDARCTYTAAIPPVCAAQASCSLSFNTNTGSCGLNDTGEYCCYAEVGKPEINCLKNDAKCTYTQASSECEISGEACIPDEGCSYTFVAPNCS